MKKWLVFACCLVPLSCFLNPTVSYIPNRIIDPAKVIERVMTTQPPERAGAVPYRVSVYNDSIKMWMPDQSDGGRNIGELYYKEIGKVVLKHTDIWYVEILDQSGIGMYNVFSFKESEAKQFIDALYTVMGK
jgi:hypothetical protein